ncbi:CMRF35-like molecule 5 [Etheostoma spectabile]|uniref:CMRF35-like molecule 5 n=1 Tax=Etheostoma spectabile TaxID=54343 RepID=UPI0013AF3EFC|nr:CMRF35-like molecule 5 [Etheostoma spectabile]
MRRWRLQSLLFTLCIALSCVGSAAELISVSGYEGREVKVACPYAEGYESYEKYLCKNDCGTKKNRYSIHDDKWKRVFTVTISDLSRMDAGKYWCGVTIIGKDIYTEVLLEVRQAAFWDNRNYAVSLSTTHREHRKFLCKGDHRKNCDDMTQSSRFMLQMMLHPALSQ